MFSSSSTTSRLTALVAALASLSAIAITPAVAAKDSRTFAVLRFHGDGPLTIGRTDPIVSPGKASSHVHVVQGSNAFGNSATGESLLADSTCSTANVAGDKSAYWMPQVYFHDPKNGSFEPVPLFYMNVYYFFEATNDDIKAFPVGLQMVSGNATLKTAPATGNDVLDPSQGTIQPAQFTCPRSSYDPPSYPANSNGSMAGIQDTGNLGAGAGFPFAECDGYASPLRADLHFPSCYDPSQPLTAYKTNTAFPTDAGDGKADCPAGWIHTPHIFYEMYWNTPLFVDRWDPAAANSQPFVLSNGDAAGFSLHGDFMAAWDTDVLQTIIDTCDAGDSGMDQCPGIETVLTGNCHVPNPTPETIDGSLAALPGNNPLFGWQYGAGEAAAVSSGSGNTSGSGSGSGSSSVAPAPASSSSTTAAVVVNAASSASAFETVSAVVAAVSGTASSSSASSPAAVVAAASSSMAAPSSSPLSPPSSSASAAAVSTSVPSTPSSSSPVAPPPSSAVSSAEAAVTGCRAPTDISTTVVTIPVTVYSTSTSTVYVTESPTIGTLITAPSSSAVVKREQHMYRHAHQRRH